MTKATIPLLGDLGAAINSLDAVNDAFDVLTLEEAKLAALIETLRQAINSGAVSTPVSEYLVVMEDQRLKVALAADALHSTAIAGHGGGHE